MPYTTRVEGWKEVVRSLDAVNRKAKRTLLAALREGADPIAVDTRNRLDRYNEISLATIRPSAGVRGVYIRQYAKRVTGKRPDFGALQMTRGFIPSLHAHETEIGDIVERAFDILVSRET